MKRAVLLFAIAALTIAAEDKTKWEQELQAQLLEEKQCDMQYITGPRTLELGGDTTISGRAHCNDGRSFDFSRLRADDPFELADCEPQVC